MADTHMPHRGSVLPRVLLTALDTADLVIHLGDFTHHSLVEKLESRGAFRAVHGNNDDLDLRHRFPLTDRFVLHGHRFVLLHGHVGGRTALQVARKVEDADVVLFGHSHLPYSEEENGTLLFNPGSPTDRRWGPHRAFGVIDVGDTVEPHIEILPWYFDSYRTSC